MLPSIRAAVAAATNNWPGQAFNPPRTLSFAAGTYVGYQFDAAGAVLGSKSYALAPPSSAPTDKSASVPGRSGTWYYVTAGVWAGYWLPASGGISINGPPQPHASASYRPWLPLYLAAGSYTGYRFNTWGNATASASYLPSAATWVPTTEKSTIPNQGGYWYYITTGALRGYWIPESAGTTLGALPMANFVASTTYGLGQLAVSFTNRSITYGAASWAWDFDNDGTTDSTEQSPVYTYTATGTYSVGLTVTDGLGTDTVTKVELHHGRYPATGDLCPAVPQPGAGHPGRERPERSVPDGRAAHRPGQRAGWGTPHRDRGDRQPDRHPADARRATCTSAPTRPPARPARP